MCLQEAKVLHEDQGVPYKDMAVLFRAFNCNGAKAHAQLQVNHGKQVVEHSTDSQ